MLKIVENLWTVGGAVNKTITSLAEELYSFSPLPLQKWYDILLINVRIKSIEATKSVLVHAIAVFYEQTGHSCCCHPMESTLKNNNTESNTEIGTLKVTSVDL